MLIALLTILFLGGDIEDAVMDYAKLTRAAIDEVVVDDAQRDEARATLKEIEKLSKDHSKSNRKTFERLLTDMAEPEMQDEAIDAIWSEYHRSVNVYNEKRIDLRFELRDALSREQWQQLFSGTGG